MCFVVARGARAGRRAIARGGEETRTCAGLRGFDGGGLALLIPGLVHDGELLERGLLLGGDGLDVHAPGRVEHADVVRVDDVALGAQHGDPRALVEGVHLAGELLPGGGHAGHLVPDAPVLGAHRSEAGGGATKERGDRSWARQILGATGRDTGFTVCTQLLRLESTCLRLLGRHIERIFSSLFHVLIRKICRNVGLDGLFCFPPHIFFPDCFTVVLIPEHSPPTGNTNKSLKSYPPKAPKDGAANAEARTGGASLPSDRARRSTSGCTTE